MKIKFPRKNHNGLVDDGKELQGEDAVCPNCSSSSYYETVSIEECRYCGLFCDYWGDGGNKIYDYMIKEKSSVQYDWEQL